MYVIQGAKGASDEQESRSLSISHAACYNEADPENHNENSEYTTFRPSSVRDLRKRKLPYIIIIKNTAEPMSE